MKGYTMASPQKNAGGLVKVEPLASASGTFISVKKDLGGRLPSFKPPRDLSLSAATSQMNSLKSMITSSTSKKVFAPNVNVTRRKGQSVAVASEVTQVADHKSSHERTRKNARNRGNFVQTQGVFSEGLGRAKPKEYSRGYETPTPQLEKPKLNLNRNTCKKKEDSKMKELLKDDFIDDPSVVPNLNDRPISLPLLLNRKEHSCLDLDATFESLQVKSEKSEADGGKSFGLHSPKMMKLFQESPSSRLLIFEFPDEIVKKEPEKKTTKEIKSEKGSKSQPAVKEDTTHRLSNIGEGLWGTLKILENGKAYIAVGKEKVPVEMTRYCPKQNVMSVELDTSSSRGVLVNLGRVSGNLTCSSDLSFPSKMK